MKLSQKLTLAFLLVSLIAIGLAALFVWLTTAQQFRQYLVDQRQLEFASVAREYYLVNGSWLGVDEALRSAGLLPPLAAPGTRQPEPQPFALIDQNRVVIIPGGRFTSGQKVQKAILARGISIDVNGLSVGTVMTTGEVPVPNVLEQKYITSVNQSLLIAAGSAALLAFLLGLLMARSLARPVRDLTRATQALAGGELAQQVAVHSRDELGELAQAFNRMSADLAQATLSRRQMTADIAHDLRNPLTVLGGTLEVLKDGTLKPTHERIEVMQAEVNHLGRLVEDLRILSLADAGELSLQRQPVQPAELLKRVAAAYETQASREGVGLQVVTGTELGTIDLDPERMEQVLGNLVSNALRYTPTGGRVSLSAEKAGTEIILAVDDTGSGIPPEVLPHIFERSYRGDPARSGDESGLGLAIARSLVNLHGGTIHAESIPGQGSRFEIRLPKPGSKVQMHPL